MVLAHFAAVSLWHPAYFAKLRYQARTWLCLAISRSSPIGWPALFYRMCDNFVVIEIATVRLAGVILGQYQGCSIAGSPPPIHQNIVGVHVPALAFWVKC